MSDGSNLVYICVHCGQVVENKDSEWHERQCPQKHANIDDDDIELNVEVVEEETPEEKQVEKDDYINRLINCVRLRTLLWDKFQKRDIPGRQKLWEEIEQELGTQPGVPRRDWAHLREKYRNEKAILRRAQQTGRQMAPRWEYYSFMTFLEQDGPSPKRTLLPKPAAKVVSTKIVTINGKQVNRSHTRAKPGPKPGSRRAAKKPLPKPITRPKRQTKPPQQHIEKPQTVNAISTTSNFGQLNELRVLVPRNDYRNLNPRKSGNTLNSVNDSNSRKRNNVDSQDDIDSVAFKQVCIRTADETQRSTVNDDDTVGRFCSYLEVMLRTLPKEKQEVFYEETLDHLATLKRQIRRSNHSNPASNYM